MSEEKPEPGTTCCEGVPFPGSFRSRQCRKAAKVIRDGKPYCGVHDPVKVKERREKKNDEWDARWEAEKAARAKAEAERAERDRRASCFDDMLEMLEAIASSSYLAESGNYALDDDLRATIAKAKGA